MHSHPKKGFANRPKKREISITAIVTLLAAIGLMHRVPGRHLRDLMYRDVYAVCGHRLLISNSHILIRFVTGR
ncbi:MAG: hypothetical protein ACLPWS_08110 [Rhodomicrobium sp.]